MKDMGMGMDHAASAAPCAPEHAAMGHCAGGHGAPAPMRHAMRDFANAPELPRTPTVQTVAPMPVDRTGEPPQGLADVEHRVLVYRDLVALARNPDVRVPSRALRIHLTGNMERYMWAFDGVKLNEVTAPIPFRQGERVRVTLVNDTMMAHPIHLHGHFFELVTGHGDHAPRKHTINVAPGGTATFDLTADAVGDWAFHCHLLYHMHAGMMQVVTVRPDCAAEAGA
jgi:FtsP/CotA-like multicopper oxidase with cupredoxin domain